MQRCRHSVASSHSVLAESVDVTEPVLRKVSKGTRKGMGCIPIISTGMLSKLALFRCTSGVTASAVSLRNDLVECLESISLLLCLPAPTLSWLERGMAWWASDRRRAVDSTESRRATSRFESMKDWGPPVDHVSQEPITSLIFTYHSESR